MTKKVRIEDADSGISFKVTVQVWNKGAVTATGGTESDTMQSEVTLYGPCDLRDFMIHSTQYIIVKEA